MRSVNCSDETGNGLEAVESTEHLHRASGGCINGSKPPSPSVDDSESAVGNTLLLFVRPAAMRRGITMSLVVVVLDSVSRAPELHRQRSYS